MTAAHELAERGFDVVVYEQRAGRGRQGAQHRRHSRHGRAPRAPRRARLPLLPRLLQAPARHDEPHPLPRAAATGCFDNLVTSTQIEIAREDAPQRARRPGALPAQRQRLGGDAALRPRRSPSHLGIPLEDQVHFVGLLSDLLSACEERRFGQYENESWWEFADAERRSVAFQKFLCRRPDPLAGGRAGTRDERAHRRLHPAPAAAGPGHARRPGRPRALRPHQRRLDRPVAGGAAAPRASTTGFGCRVDAIESRSGRVTRVSGQRVDAAGRRSARAGRTAPTTTWRRCRSRSCASASRWTRSSARARRCSAWTS